MAYFPANHPQNPTNRCHTIYLAALQAIGPGVRVSQDKWRSMVKVGTGVIVARQVDDYTQTMEDLLMLKRHGRDGIELLADGLRLLSDALESIETSPPIAQLLSGRVETPSPPPAPSLEPLLLS